MSLHEQEREAPSAGRIAVMAWRSTSAAAACTPTGFLAALAVIATAMIVERLATQTFSAAVESSFSWSYILKSRAVALAFEAIEGAAVALVAVPVYRLVLREETMAAIDLLRERTLRLAAWIAAYRVLTFILLLPSVFAKSIAAGIGTSYGMLLLYFALYGVVIQLVLLYVWARFGLLYPEVALDIPAGDRGRFRKAWQLSAPVQWRIVWSAMIVFVPIYSAATALALFGNFGAGGRLHVARGGGISWGDVIGYDVLMVAGAALGAAVLAWNYRFITGRHHELTAETFA